MIPLCNLHTHTVFCDGVNTPEEMVQSAIKLGLHTLGFSGHTPVPVSGDTEWCMSEEDMLVYRDQILDLKRKYQDQIEILLGLEVDYDSQTPMIECDYKIGSVHYVQKSGVFIPVDGSYDLIMEQLGVLYRGDLNAFLRDYYDSVAKVVDKTDCDIVGHFDLITKFNEKYSYIDESNSSYQNMALEALDAVLEKDVFIEINTGAISRGWRTTPYPAAFILRRIAEKGGKLILNSDAHKASDLLFGFEDAVSFAASCGVRELWIYREKAFDSVEI